MQTRRVLLFGAALLATIAVAVLLGVGAGNLWAEKRQHDTEKMRAAFTDQILEQMEHLQPGDTLPNARLMDLQRNLVPLHTMLKDPTLLVFFDYSCENCLVELEHLAQNITDPAVANHIILVSATNPLYLLQVRDEQAVTSPILYDDHMRFMDAIGVGTFPFNLYVGADGVIDSAIASSLGARDFERFSQAVLSR